MSKPPFILFSDLDGTLLDPLTYQPDGAEAALEHLREARVPLVFCSSKTFEEMIFYQKQLSIQAPFIVENGGAVFVPAGFFHFEIDFDTRRKGFLVKELGASSTFIRQKLTDVAGKLGMVVRGFSDLATKELAELTGLDEASAERAKRKDYSETLAAPTDLPSLDELKKYLASHGLALTSGSRFFTVHGAAADKGRAAAWLIRLFRQAHGQIPVAAVGDAANDLPMLRRADRGFLVQKPCGSWAETLDEQVERAPFVGTKGFEWVVRRLVENLT